MSFTGEYDKDIYYTVIKINDSIEGTIEYRPTDEECKIKFTIDTDNDVCICKNVYRRVKGEARYVFLMSKESVRVKSLIEKIYMDVIGRFPKEIQIFPDFCLQNRLQKRAESISESISESDRQSPINEISEDSVFEFKTFGTWEEDNIDFY
jgi:hypothetical protein